MQVERLAYSLLKALVWKAPTALLKRPAPIKRRKFVIATMKIVRAEKMENLISTYSLTNGREAYWFDWQTHRSRNRKRDHR